MGLREVVFTIPNGGSQSNVADLPFGVLQFVDAPDCDSSNMLTLISFDGTLFKTIGPSGGANLLIAVVFAQFIYSSAYANNLDYIVGAKFRIQLSVVQTATRTFKFLFRTPDAPGQY